jgi:hypothetical protein
MPPAVLIIEEFSVCERERGGEREREINEGT